MRKHKQEAIEHQVGRRAQVMAILELANVSFARTYIGRMLNAPLSNR